MNELDQVDELGQDVTWSDDEISNRDELVDSELDVYSTELEGLYETN